MTAPPNALTRKSRKDIEAATGQVIGMARLEPGVTWPEDLLAAALARDGAPLVIRYLSDLAAGPAITVSRHAGEDHKTVFQCTLRMAQMGPGQLGSGTAPFTDQAWVRAVDLVLHRLGGPLPPQGNDSIAPVDLAGALLLLHVLGCMQIAGWNTDPEHMRATLRATSAAGRPHAPADRPPPAPSHKPGGHTAADADAPLDDPLEAAIGRWAPMPHIEIELHPLLVPDISAGLHTLSQGLAATSHMRELLATESDRLRQLHGALSRTWGPHAVPPVAVTVPRQVALMIVGVLQLLSRTPATPDRIQNLARTEGHRLQDLVCDDDQLHALTDTRWR